MKITIHIYNSYLTDDSVYDYSLKYNLFGEMRWGRLI